MNLLFWILWIIDLGLCAILFIANGFRKSFTATDLNLWFSLLLFSCLISSLVFRLGLRKYTWSLSLAALPLVVLLLWYGIEKATASRS